MVRLGLELELGLELGLGLANQPEKLASSSAGSARVSCARPTWLGLGLGSGSGLGLGLGLGLANLQQGPHVARVDPACLRRRGHTRRVVAQGRMRGADARMALRPLRCQSGQGSEAGQGPGVISRQREGVALVRG